MRSIKGIGHATEKKLIEAGICTVDDAVRRIPNRYEARFLTNSDAMDADQNRYYAGVVTGKVQLHKVRAKLVVVSFPVKLKDAVYTVKTFNRPYLMHQLKVGDEIVLYGKCERKNVLTCADVRLRRYFRESIEPIYRIPGVSDRRFQSIALTCLNTFAEDDILPTALRQRHALPDITRVYKTLHHPQDATALAQALTRLKYQELLIYQLKVHWHKALRKNTQGTAKHVQRETIQPFLETLPFSLTPSQTKAVAEILHDLKRPVAMRRLLQGDTGSGKTLVAFIAMLAAIRAGYQCAFMVPTEILAAQHYDNLKRHFESADIHSALLSGSTTPIARKRILADLQDGRLHAVIGTHALFGKDVVFSRLGLVVTDEQHRFGVRQREALRRKGTHPDTLYLSATPIPRTLAMTLFGDMDITTLTDKPHGARRVKTKVVTVDARLEIRAAIRAAVERNERVFVVVPLIEEDETSPYHGINTVADGLKKRFPDVAVGVLHGRMLPDEKQRTLKDFRDGTLKILAATSVVEVGLHIPDATLMIVYHADRFGYAQLHQLRGRIGREKKAGLCYLVHRANDATYRRLKVLETVDDGFVLSEYDLKQRGFGELFGVMQSGIPQFIHARLDEDISLIETARHDAEQLMAEHIATAAHKRLIDSIKDQTST